MESATDPAPGRAVEDRRLKAAGLVLIALAGTALVLVSDRAAAQWPMPVERFVPFGLAFLLAVNVGTLGLLVLAAGCGAGQAMRQPSRRWAIALQWLLANLASPLLLLALIESRTSLGVDLEGSNWSMVAPLAAYAIFVLSMRIWRRSRQLEAPDAAEAMQRDRRPPVLYLRSFRDDDEAALDDGSRLTRWSMQLLRPSSPEQELADILGRIGPVVAIGKPGEPLPQLGAARLYVAHDLWQAKVMALMAEARLVVVRVGTSPGVLWEIEQALATLPRQRLVLAILGGGAVAPALVARLAPALGPTFEAALPQLPSRSWKALLFRDPRRRLGGIVGFAANGNAFAVPVRAWPIALADVPLCMVLRISAPALRAAWRQVFLRLDIPWLDAAAWRSRAMAVVLATLFGGFGAHWFYLGDRRRGWLYLAFLPLLVPLALGWIDALRFLWVDRDAFDSRFVVLRNAEGAANMVAHHGAPP